MQTHYLFYGIFIVLDVTALAFAQIINMGDTGT